MVKRVHPIAGVAGMLVILAFWGSTVVAELSGSRRVIIEVKQTLPWGLIALIPALAITGMSGFRLARGSRAPLIARKRRRMAIIAGNGLMVLVPAVLFLDHLASNGDLGPAFAVVQALELLAGAINLTLLALSVRDGLRLSGRARRPGQASS